MAKRKIQPCCYCEATALCEEEHAISECLWENLPVPANTVKVPACSRCNRFWSIYEGRFRSHLALMAAKSGKHPLPPQMVNGGSVESHFYKDQKFRRQLENSLRVVPKIQENGLWVGNEAVIALDLEAWYTVLGKMVRALFYDRKQHALSRSYQVSIVNGDRFLTDPEMQPFLGELGVWLNMGPGDDVFFAKRSTDYDDPNIMCFVFYFFQSVGVMAFTEPINGTIHDPSHPARVDLEIAERERRKRYYASRKRLS